MDIIDLLCIALLAFLALDILFCLSAALKLYEELKGEKQIFKYSNEFPDITRAKDDIGLCEREPSTKPEEGN